MKIPGKIKKITVLLIISGIMIMPFSSLIPKANAQTGSASGYMTGLAPAIAQLPGCRAIATNGIKKIFKGLNYDTGGKGQSSTDMDNLINKESSASMELESVLVTDKVNQKLSEKNLEKSTNIEASIGSVDKNQNCMNAIGKMIVKILIQKLTLSIVNWIQTGYQGNPSFVENPTRFFGDIAKNEILGFGLEIDNAGLYPFAKAFMQNVALSFNNKFAVNAQYSLDKMIAQTTPDCRDKKGNRVNCDKAFYADFSQGGWGAWQAMTQVPANNPLGFQLMASNELGKRLEGTGQSVANEVRQALSEADGYLGDERCTDPWGVTKQQHEKYLKEDPEGKKCNKWEYVTPGAVIAHSANKIVDYKDNSLLDAETLNDAIAAILDAVMARFSNSLTEKGLAKMNALELGTNPYEISTTQNEWDIEDGVSKDFPESQIRASTWLQQNPDFDIRTDFNQALIDEQRTYVDKLKEQNDVLPELVKTIRQLDYCIPGPNPEWEETSSEIMKNILSGEKMNKETTKWLDTINTIANGTGITALQPGLGSIIGGIGMIVEKKEQEELRKDIANFIQNVLMVDIDSDQSEILDMSGISSFFESVFQSYRNLTNQIYFTPTNPNYSLYMPEVTSEARVEFKKIKGYNQMMKDNEVEITLKKSVITRLEGIKNSVDGLNAQLNSGNLSQADYETALKPWINSFGRLSYELVSGDDIAIVDNQNKQAVDEKDYVNNDLLKGPVGCEKFMSNLWSTNKAMYSKYARRQPYPFEIENFYGPVNANGGPYYIQWTPTSLEKGWDPNEGFLFGALYHNDGYGPWSNDLNSHICDEYIGVIQTSNIKGFDTTANTNYLPNRCGVVTVGFEKRFGVY